MTSMFGFTAYGFAVAGAMIMKKAVSPSTGKPYTILEIVTVTQALHASMMSMGSIVPILPGIIKGLAAGKRVFDVIERTPAI